MTETKTENTDTKVERVFCRLSKSDMDALNELAARFDRPVSYLVRHAVKKYLIDSDEPISKRELADTEFEP